MTQHRVFEPFFRVLEMRGRIKYVLNRKVEQAIAPLFGIFDETGHQILCPKMNLMHVLLVFGCSCEPENTISGMYPIVGNYFEILLYKLTPTHIWPK